MIYYMKVFNTVIKKGGGNPTVIDITDKSTLNLSNDVEYACYSLYSNDAAVGKSIDIDVTTTQPLYILVKKIGPSLNINIRLNGEVTKSINAPEVLFKLVNPGSWVIEQFLLNQG